MLPPGRPPSKRPATGETPGHGRHATTLPEAGAPESHVTPSRPTCRMFTTLTQELVISINCEHAQCPWTFESNAAKAARHFFPIYRRVCQILPFLSESFPRGQTVLVQSTFSIKFGKFGSISDKITLFFFSSAQNVQTLYFYKKWAFLWCNRPGKAHSFL